MPPRETLQRIVTALALAASACSAATLPPAAGTMPVANAAGASATARAAIEAAFSRADVNGDGKLSREEAIHLPEIAARFDALDTDKDQFLTLEEFSIGATPTSN